ncbi:ThiJ/PfpI family protein [Cordyceps fumosorosea ARSEF 2679]|uniref:ThiJ/PfpI family protein n=1 Tax=Cordyceps fumosorosea (strain ARSEF 2679) TaxID=1081104 RepID=A0A167LKG6_CORFA|nr:ThiJ/PfpI family protein [Cordyceps fumosorosea ARSEF 2679]OAA53191.1 ThiJ/PfpI family protein [Cordyceps fumosorosea ARSEF 2679]
MFNLTNPDRAIRVGVILLKGIAELIDVAPVELFRHVSHEFVDYLPSSAVPAQLKPQAHHFEYHWVSEAGSKSLMKGTSGSTIVPTDSFKTCPPLDIVIIGASGASNPSPAELQFLQKSYNDSSAFITTCFGMLGPLKAGLFDGKTATAPSFFLDELRATNPNTTWVDKRWARDGKLWTSGTLLNGINVVTAFIQHTWGSGDGSLPDVMGKFAAWPTGTDSYDEIV